MKHPLKILDKVNESSLDEDERLGLAWCRLNYGGWDSLLGPEPDPDNRLACSILGMSSIESIIGTAQADWYAWKFLRLGNRNEWLRWWLTKDFLKTSQLKHEVATIKDVKAMRRLMRSGYLQDVKKKIPSCRKLIKKVNPK